MAALLPLLQEILPMLMPGSVHVTKADELRGPPPGLEEEEEEEEEAEAEAGEGSEKEGREAGDAATADGQTAQQSPTRRPRRQANRSVEGQEGEAVESSTKDVGDDASGADDADESEADEHAAGQSKADSETPPPPPPAARPRRSRHPRLRHNGVSLRDAIVGRSSSLCASVLTVRPGCATVVFHNGEQEAIVYAVSGTAVLATLPEDFDEYSEGDEEDGGSSASKKRHAPATHVLAAGDFAFIPAWTEHQVRNAGEGAAEDVVWVVVRNAGEPTVVPLQGWGGEQVR